MDDVNYFKVSIFSYYICNLIHIIDFSKFIKYYDPYAQKTESNFGPGLS